LPIVPAHEPAGEPFLRLVRRPADERRADRYAPRRHPVPARRDWPADLGPAGKALSVGVAILAAEVGVSWLRRKVGAEDQSSILAVRSTGYALHGYLLSHSLEEGLVQIWEGDSHNRIFARREVRSIARLTPPTTTKAGGYYRS
jgi:hypothetical protein